MADNDLLKRLLDAGMTFTALTQARAEEVVRDLVRTGAVQAEQAQASVDELLERSRRNRERLVGAVRSEIDDQLAKLDLATRDDLDRMVQRFADVAATLIAQVSPDRGSDTPAPSSGAATSTSDRRAPGAATSPAKKTPAKKTPAKKTPAKATGSGSAGSGVASSAVKQSPAKSSPAKSSAKKSSAKKAPAKKTASKKSSAKKAPAKKTASKKSSGSAKKTASKKSSGSSKKATGQKAAGGRSSSDR